MIDLPVQNINLQEWEERNIPGMLFSLKELEALQQLNGRGLIEIIPMTTGARIKANSHVGTISIGALNINIRPKIDNLPLFSLFRYGYNLCDIKMFDEQALKTEITGIREIIILKYLDEIKSLIRKGIIRKYHRENRDLSSPRGRIDMNDLALRKAVPSDRLDCIFYNRHTDNIHNRIILAGLNLCAKITLSSELAFKCRRFAEILSDGVSRINLSGEIFRQAKAMRNRLNAHYDPAIGFARLIYDSSGAAIEKPETGFRVSGFLFDMNRLFQRVLFRFLNENLADYQVMHEKGINGVFTYVPESNPRRNNNPVLRPDYVIRRDGKTVAVLDAKYRDLWGNRLPENMLYQLSIYALGHTSLKKATILYPSMSSFAGESSISINDPIHKGRLGIVNLRPVNIPEMVRYIDSGNNMKPEKKMFAEFLSFGRKFAIETERDYPISSANSNGVKRKPRFFKKASFPLGNPLP